MPKALSKIITLLLLIENLQEPEPPVGSDLSHNKQIAAVISNHPRQQLAAGSHQQQQTFWAFGSF